MKKYIIYDDNGYEMGVYKGETRREALDAYAKDAGYESFEELEPRGDEVIMYEV